MKSGLAALVIAMIEIKENNLLKQGTIRLMATTGEEVGEAGSQKFFEDGYSKDIDALVIAEPSEDTIVNTHKGSMNFKITSTGQSAHSSMPHLGHNAINQLMGYLTKANKIFNEDRRENTTLGKLVMSPTIFNGGNQVNSVPEYAQAELNVRTIPEFDNEEVKAIFNELANKYNSERHEIDVDIMMSLNSVFTDSDTLITKLAQSLGNKYFGSQPEIKSSPGVTDASNLLVDKPNNFNFIFYGLGLTSMAHQTNEYVKKDVYVKFADLYKDLFIDLSEKL
ncbi:peptidase M20 family protein [Tetragenococcus halophilus subsp. halophilus]|uniref:Acetylornithine deacetylase n=3 Tax=Tetragenococcus TaxID=51668 RepID=A0A091C5H3_9ENTE|nr:ArgE/DapE family deacylase [Tetragenococcus halophilus]KFN93101.1 acetylornithine deacetylase [Tetragenococcus muriaticus 3MR10-3]BAK93461.1 peptidase M20 family protein [Tetragenococcus halophilus NBRC 12172]GMA44702.1 hypothetical protein GCM10025853_21590 [Tetragenococcus halophilus subsp. halophilus DSM 20339]GBD60031.1 peptidase M20 family protein [Tetragenococcus halophilus subsp. halophilus]GBD65268.1 peptidase M20 family protein [Tetragenococcus halophilus subsp. halophilus]